jgi:hypothetical protein
MELEPILVRFFFLSFIIASALVKNSIEAMKMDGVDEVRLLCRHFVDAY